MQLLGPGRTNHHTAELMESSENSNISIVAEIDGKVVGFMKASRVYNQDILRENYHLEIFNNLVKCNSVLVILGKYFEKEDDQSQSEQNSFYISLFCRIYFQ